MTFSENDSGILIADKSFAEVISAIKNGSNVYAFFDGYFLNLFSYDEIHGTIVFLSTICIGSELRTSSVEMNAEGENIYTMNTKRLTHNSRVINVNVNRNVYTPDDIYFNIASDLKYGIACLYLFRTPSDTSITVVLPKLDNTNQRIELKYKDITLYHTTSGISEAT